MENFLFFVGINNNELEYTERLFVRVNHKNELYFSIYRFKIRQTGFEYHKLT